jgi:uncharacterized protein (TIGR02246 family)
MIEQMAEALMSQDDDAIISFFADDAVMITPSGRLIGKQAIYDAGHGFNQAYTGIVIKVKEVLCCSTKGVVEWSFAETRKSDGYTRIMEDAIVFHLRDDGKVIYWREYFDPNQVDVV